jgi:hypothetical protein
VSFIDSSPLPVDFWQAWVRKRHQRDSISCVRARMGLFIRLWKTLGKTDRRC